VFFEILDTKSENTLKNTRIVLPEVNDPTQNRNWNRISLRISDKNRNVPAESRLRINRRTIQLHLEQKLGNQNIPIVQNAFNKMSDLIVDGSLNFPLCAQQIHFKNIRLRQFNVLVLTSIEELDHRASLQSRIENEVVEARAGLKEPSEFARVEMEKTRREWNGVVYVIANNGILVQVFLQFRHSPTRN
jgi:hypothetical protein